MTLTREGLEEALELTSLASPSPWRAVEFSNGGIRLYAYARKLPFARLYVNYGANPENAERTPDDDAAFIAFSREAVPAMAQALLRVMDAIEKGNFHLSMCGCGECDGWAKMKLRLRAALLGSDEAR